MAEGPTVPPVAERSEICTGLTATWCDVHGKCICPPLYDSEGDPGWSPTTGDSDLDDPNCPLHSVDSAHPIDSLLTDAELLALPPDTYAVTHIPTGMERRWRVNG